MNVLPFATRAFARQAAMMSVLAAAACRAPSTAPLSTAAQVTVAQGTTATTRIPREHGLVAVISDGERHVETVVPTPNFTLAAGESIHPGTGAAFTVAFVADLEATDAGKYRFYTSALPTDVEIKIDNQVVGSAEVALTQGKHAFAFTYRRPSGPARLLVEWSSDAFAREPIPSSAFSPTSWTSEGQRWQQIDAGRALYDDLGCRGCHQRAGDDPHVDNFYHITRRGRGPGLSRAGRRLSRGWIYAFLGNPRSHRSNTKMPNVLHTDSERADVAAFLSSLQEQGANSSRDEGPWLEPPLSDSEKDKAESLFNSIGCTACHGASEDKVSLANVGSKYDPFALVEYMMRPDNFDHSGRMPGMLRGGEGTLLARWLLVNRKPSLEKAPPPGNVARGRSLVQSKGCLGCHSIDLEGLQQFTTLVAPRFEALPAEHRGCLSDAASKRHANYELTDAQRDAILAYLRVKEASPSPLWELARTLDSRGCRNCHETDVPARTLHAEVPPSLRDAGHKLRPEWIARQLDARGATTRPWFTLRMPRFHRAGNLGALLAAGAGEPTTLPKVVPLAEPASRVVQEGVQYLGRAEGGMSCVTCHRYATFDPKSATPAPDLATAAQRLRAPWFNRWLRDPLRITPGTQMPAFFSGVDEDFAAARINALWTALSLGKKMPPPDGVDLSDAHLPYPLHEKPVVVRTFLEGSGPRSLAVGFKGAAFAFDAETCRLVYTWTGDFLDMRPVWVGHGGEMAVPMGRVTYRAGKAPVLQIEGDEKIAPRFKGYSNAPDGPHLKYQLGSVLIDDHVRPSADGKGFLRTLRLRGGPEATRITLGLDPGVSLVSPKSQTTAFAVPRHGNLTIELHISHNAAGPKP